MTVATLVGADQARTGPRGFVPPLVGAADTRSRLSHLDPRPLWLAEAAAQSPWRSPTFWLAYALVMPIAAIARSLRKLRLTR